MQKGKAHPLRANRSPLRRRQQTALNGAIGGASLTFIFSLLRDQQDASLLIDTHACLWWLSSRPHVCLECRIQSVSLSHFDESINRLQVSISPQRAKQLEDIRSTWVCQKTSRAADYAASFTYRVLATFVRLQSHHHARKCSQPARILAYLDMAEHSNNCHI